MYQEPSIDIESSVVDSQIQGIVFNLPISLTVLLGFTVKFVVDLETDVD